MTTKVQAVTHPFVSSVRSELETVTSSLGAIKPVKRWIASSWGLFWWRNVKRPDPPSARKGTGEPGLVSRGHGPCATGQLQVLLPTAGTA
jgi:hypothetical protein